MLLSNLISALFVVSSITSTAVSRWDSSNEFNNSYQYIGNGENASTSVVFADDDLETQFTNSLLIQPLDSNNIPQDFAYYTISTSRIFVSFDLIQGADYDYVRFSYNVTFNQEPNNLPSQSVFDSLRAFYGDEYFVCTTINCALIPFDNDYRNGVYFSWTHIDSLFKPTFESFSKDDEDDIRFMIDYTDDRFFLIVYFEYIVFDSYYFSQDIYNNGYSTGYHTGESIGKSIGYNEGLNAQDIWRLDNYLFAIADIPFIVMRNFFNDSLFGGPGLFVICMSLVTAALIIGIIRRFI